MAGERLGRCYEAFLFHAAREAAKKLAPRREVHWNPSLPSLMVEPDISVGPMNDPQTIVMITQSAARRTWDKKFWRNIGEIVDIRGALPDARIVSVTLGTEIKEELADVLARLVDDNVFPDRPTRQEIEDWMSGFVAGASKDRDELLEQISEVIARAPALVQAFSVEAGKRIVRRATAVRCWTPASQWLSRRNRDISRNPVAWPEPIYVRRGLSKLLVAGGPDLVLGSIDARLKVEGSVGRALAESGWATKAIAGWRVSDPEIAGVLQAYPRDVIQWVLHDCMSAEMSAMCADISSNEWLDEVRDFLLQSERHLRSPEWLARQMEACRKDPSLGGKLKHVPHKLSGVWIYRALVAMIKVAAQKKQGFGYEQFVADVRALAGDGDALQPILNAGGTDKAIRAAGTTDSLRRKLVDWVSGLAECELAQWQVLLVSTVLSNRIGAIPKERFVNAASEFPAFLRRATYEDRIASYPYFEPLPSLLRYFLNKEGVDHVLSERFPTLVSECSESVRGPGTIQVLIVGDTIVHWKSVSDVGRDHKTKELCGRGFTLRHRLSDSGLVVPFKGVARLVLVLDGEFSEKDVSNLRRAGWDLVVPSSEIASLAVQLGADLRGD
jgi:hypothetical protein